MNYCVGSYDTNLHQHATLLGIFVLSLPSLSVLSAPFYQAHFVVYSYL